jgi:hypothetical protein
MRECSSCEWCKDLEDSEGRAIYFCMDANSGAYLEETSLYGNCDLEG